MTDDMAYSHKSFSLMSIYQKHRHSSSHKIQQMLQSQEKLKQEVLQRGSTALNTRRKLRPSHHANIESNQICTQVVALTNALLVLEALCNYKLSSLPKTLGQLSQIRCSSVEYSSLWGPKKRECRHTFKTISILVVSCFRKTKISTDVTRSYKRFRLSEILNFNVTFNDTYNAYMHIV